MRIETKHLNRNPGLDLLRAIAIGFVLVYHLPFADRVQALGVFGVEIFLTLSGFLVAGMIFERFGGIRESVELKSFLVNRWLRTLPLYYLTLVATAVLTIWLGQDLPADVGVFFVFMQNVTQGGQAAHDSWFGASWSLALEEWFYLLLPLTLWVSRGQSPGRTIIALTIVLAAMALGGRTYRFLTETVFDFDDMYRRTLIFRLDTFCWGMLVYLALRRWEVEVVRHRLALFIAGIAIIVLTMFAASSPDYGRPFQAIAMLTTISIGTALFIPFFRGLEITGSAPRMLFYVLSTRTYALYLTHGLVYGMIARHLDTGSIATSVLMLATSLLVADLVYRYIERPILALRNADTARPLVKVSAIMARIQTRIAFEFELLTRRHDLPVPAHALVERRKMPRI